MATKGKPKSILKFDKPSGWWGAMWREAIPTGNGVIGASVQGGAGEESILINHSFLTWQGYTGVLQDVSDKIKEVRKQIDFGDYRKANDIMAASLVTKGYRPVPSVPLPLVDFKVSMPFEKPVKEYSRVLNMETGEICVSYKDGATRYERNLFVSRTSDIVVYEIVKVGPKNIDAEFSLDMHDRTNVRTPVAISKLPENMVNKCEGAFMYYSARNDNGTDFGAVARLYPYGGSVEVKQNSIHIKGAEKVLVLLKPFVESQRDKEFKALRASLMTIKLTYDKLLKEHVAVHSKLFSAGDFDLDADNREASIDDLMYDAVSLGDVKNALIEKMWAFGRFLFITSTGPTARIMRPYGLWCGDYKAIASHSNAMGSLQMLYSQAMSGGLADFMLPVFDKYENVLDDLKKNATRLYNCRGIFVPGVTAPGSGLLGIIDPAVIHSTWIAGSLGNLFYDYYLYTQDAKFLKTRALPFMKEVALFYEEFFKVKLDGFFDSSPSYSYDNTPAGIADNGQSLEIARNSMIDFAVAKELLGNLIKGAEETNAYKAELEKWKEMYGRIPNYVINDDGTVKEYLDTRLQDNHASRSLNQLYGVFPGTEAVERDPDLFKACLATARKRFVSGVKYHNANSMTKLASVFARLGDASDALEALQTVIRNFTMDNLVTASNDWRGMGIGDQNAWATYQLDGNMGVTSAIQEMLVTSREGMIRLLPALPSDWRKGSIGGMLTRCGAEVEVSWDYTKKPVSTAKIRCRRTNKIDIVLPAGVTKVKGIAPELYDASTNTVKGLDMQNGKVVTITF